MQLQKQLTALVSQQEVQLHAAKMAYDKALRTQSLQRKELETAQTQVADLTQESAELSR